jgi:hypothetical protein
VDANNKKEKEEKAEKKREKGDREKVGLDRQSRTLKKKKEIKGK